MFDIDFPSPLQWWHEHTVKGDGSVVEGGAERTAHLISLFWVNLFTCGKLVSPQKKILFRVLLLFSWFKWYCFEVTAIFNTTDWWVFIFFLTVMSLKCSADLVTHSLFFCMFYFFSSCDSDFFQTAFHFPFALSFQISACMTNSSSLCSLHSKEQGACTSATLLGVKGVWVLVSTGCVKSVTLVIVWPG